LTNKTLYGAIISVLGALLTIVLNIILIPKIGYMGSAWANFVCYFIMMVVSYFWGRNVYKVQYNFKKIFFYCISAGLLYLASVEIKSFLGKPNLIMNTLLFILFLTAVYFGEIRAFRKNLSEY
jgi:O-antigen/teichoic acid export membrane protein